MIQIRNIVLEQHQVF